MKPQRKSNRSKKPEVVQTIEANPPVKQLNKLTKPLKGWRTLIFNGAASVLPLVDAVGQIAAVPELAGVLPPHIYPYYIAGVTVVNFGLRLFTNSPVGKKI